MNSDKQSPSIGIRIERVFQGLAKSPRLAVASATTIFIVDVLQLGHELIYFLLLLTGVFLWIWLRSLMRRRRRRANISTVCKTVFPQVKRTQLARRIAGEILAEHRHIQIVAGRSGSGKSLLISDILEQIDVLRHDGRPGPGRMVAVTIEQYSSLTNQILAQLRKKSAPSEAPKCIESYVKDLGAASDRLFVLVLDQFELLIANDSRKKERQDLLVEFGRLVTLASMHPQFRIVIVLKKDALPDVYACRDLIPRLSEAIIVDGITASDDGPALKEIIDQTRSIVYDHGIFGTLLSYLGNRASISGEDLTSGTSISAPPQAQALLPLELATLVRASVIFRGHRRLAWRQAGKSAKDGKHEAVENFGQVAMQEFFTYHIESFSERDNVSRVLFALSINPRVSLRVEDIWNLTWVRVRQIEKILSSFQQYGLVTEDDGGVWRWHYEFFGEQFNLNSSSFLDLADRGDIQLRFEQLANASMLPSVHETENLAVKENFSMAVLALSLLLLFMRTFSPLIIHITWPTTAVLSYFPFFMPLSMFTYKNMDASFLPIALSLSFWSWYVTAFYRRILARIGEHSKIQMVFSGIVAVWSLLCVMFSIWQPTYWVTFVGLGGILVGVKYYFLGGMPDAQLNRRRLRQIGKKTFWNSIAMGAFFGPIYANMFAPQSFLQWIYQTDQILFGMTCLMAALMLYFANSVIHDHVGEENIPGLIGGYARAEGQERE